MKLINRMIVLNLAMLVMGLSSSCEKIKQQTPGFRDVELIDYNTAINIEVNDISFERNGLYLNGISYIGSGVSWYSEIHFEDSIFTFEKIKPPFILRKEKNNDTLEIIKGNRNFYLSIGEALKKSGR